MHPFFFGDVVKLNMLKRKDRFKIAFSSLKLGKHSFEFEIGPEFFKGFDCTIIEKAHIHVEADMEKRANMLVFEFALKGEIFTDCARCTAEVAIPVSGTEHLIVKFGDSAEVELNDEIIWLPESAFEIDLSQQLYEYIHLLLPVRSVHKSKKDCDPEVLEKLEKLLVKKDESEIDPRWEELKKLKKD